MKEMMRLVLSLTLICLVCSSVLAYVYGITKEPIAQALETRTVKAASAVMPAGCGTPEKKAADGFSYFVASRDGKPAAIALEGVSANGYGGDVKLMVGLGMDGKFVNFEIIQASETPGLGMKMSGEAFRAPLRGHAIDSEWKVKKDGGDVDAITAATISSRAVMECIRDAIAKYKTVCHP